MRHGKGGCTCDEFCSYWLLLGGEGAERWSQNVKPSRIGGCQVFHPGFTSTNNILEGDEGRWRMGKKDRCRMNVDGIADSHRSIRNVFASRELDTAFF